MESIKDKVAIVGMGCTQFGERWDKGVEDLLVEAGYEAFEDAGIEPKQIQAASAMCRVDGWRRGQPHSGLCTTGFESPFSIHIKELPEMSVTWSMVG